MRSSPRDRVPLADIALGLVGAAVASYLFVMYQELAQRPGNLTTMDFPGWPASASRSCWKRPAAPWARPRAVIAIVFLAYSLAGPLDAFPAGPPRVSLHALANHQWITTEGVRHRPWGPHQLRLPVRAVWRPARARRWGHYFIQPRLQPAGSPAGGPAKAAVVASAPTGVISGSSIANVVTTGTFTIPMMKRVGFSKEKAGAVEVASSVNGQIMPPVMGLRPS